MGLGPVTWIVLNELLPTRARSAGVSLGTAANRIATAILNGILLTMFDTVKVQGTFAVFALFSLAGFVAVLALVPETKGMSLEELEGRVERKGE